MRTNKFTNLWSKYYFYVCIILCLCWTSYNTYITHTNIIDAKEHKAQQLAKKQMPLAQRIAAIQQDKYWKADSSNLMISESLDSIFPSNIESFKHIDFLLLEQTNVRTLPKSFAQLRQLKSLCLYVNKFDSLPEVITLLENLEELEVAHNGIIYVPPSISAMKNLKRLSFQNTIFGQEHYQITEDIGRIPNLESLSIWGTDSLPKHLDNAKNIKHLTLFDSHFTSYPDFIFECENLETLNLFFLGSKLPPIPKDFARLQHLDDLLIHGCERTEEQKEQLQQLLPQTNIEF